MIIESFMFSIKKATQYRANVISWILADISLYLATFLTYYFLMLSVDTIGDYYNFEILLYISSFLLVNNIFAVLFSDATSEFLNSILNGRLYILMLRPRHIIANSILSNFNLPPLITTPFLVVSNIFIINLTGAYFSFIYVAIIISGAITMGLIYFLVFSLALRGFRINLIASILFQVIQISERPDTVFPNRIRNIFIYVIPIFLFSAIPTRFLLGRVTNYEIVWALIAPVILFVLLQISIFQGFKKYKEGTV